MCVARQWFNSAIISPMVQSPLKRQSPQDCVNTCNETPMLNENWSDTERDVARSCCISAEAQVAERVQFALVRREKVRINAEATRFENDDFSLQQNATTAVASVKFLHGFWFQLFNSATRITGTRAMLRIVRSNSGLDTVCRSVV